MFKKILVPTDGSEGVEKAIECAAAIAGRFAAEIHVLFAVESVYNIVYYEPILTPPAGLEALTRNFHQAAQEAVDKTVKKLSALGVQKVRGEVREGYPADVVLAYAKEAGIDLIVMGTHGRRGLNRVLLGSVADEVVHHATVPVMTVRMVE